MTTGERGPMGAQGPTLRADQMPPLWGPADQGLVGWSFDPLDTSAFPRNIPGSNMYGYQVKLARPVQVTHLCWFAEAAFTLTAGNFIALYTLNGNLIVGSGEQQTNWNGRVKVVIDTAVTPTSVNAGSYYVVLRLTYSSAFPLPHFDVNENLELQTKWRAIVSAANTSPPAVLPSMVHTNYVFWVGVKGIYL